MLTHRKLIFQIAPLAYKPNAAFLIIFRQDENGNGIWLIDHRDFERELAEAISFCLITCAHTLKNVC